MKNTVIVLPSYIPDEEVLAHYKEFIASLRANTIYDHYALAIVDNGSPFGAEEMQSDADYYMHFDAPLGYARAVNLGLNAMFARGYERAVVVNNDIVFTEPGWLEKLHEVYDIIKTEHGGGLLSPQDIPTEKRLLYHDESWYSLWMIDEKTWHTVGDLDEEKLNYRFHDQDYSIRLKKAGLFVGRTGEVFVKHAGSATYKKMNRNEDPAERDEMIARHGHALFSEWMKNSYVAPAER